jgi:ABC-type polysaccharide/polyol phosphate transport system ATPase subunit
MKSGEKMNLEERHIFGAHGNYRIDYVNLPKNKMAVSFDGITKRYRIYKSDGQKFVMLFSKRLRRDIPLDTHLKNVSLTIDKGEYVNLCGNYDKSRLALCDLLLGVVYPDFGRIWINGTADNIKSLRAGFVPYLSANENITQMLKLRLMSKGEIDPLLKRILDFAEIPAGIAEKKLRELTPKSQARLKTSYMLHVPYNVLVMDEALPNAGAEYTRKCTSYIQSMLYSKSICVIHSSRAPVTNNKLVTRTLLLGKTGIRHDGDAARAAEIYKKTETKLIEMEKKTE